MRGSSHDYHPGRRSVVLGRSAQHTSVGWAEQRDELWLTVIGDQWFPIAIHAATESAHTDWRSDPSALTYEFVPVPDSVADGVSQYLTRMNLAYAGLDFVVMPREEEWVLLEANLGPQFGWLESATGAPMVAALADLLMKGNT